MTKNFNNIPLPELQLLSKTRPAKLGLGSTRVMNLSWTSLSEDVFLSLGVKTLWKTKLWLIRAKRKKTHHGYNCATKSPEPHLAVAARLFWSLLSSRIQLSSLRQSNPLKKNFTEHIIYTLCDWTAINKQRYLTHRGFFPRMHCELSIAIKCSPSVYPPLHWSSNTRVAIRSICIRCDDPIVLFFHSVCGGGCKHRSNMLFSGDLSSSFE